MRFWVVAFVVMFVGMELLDWVAQLGSWQPGGMWMILGGMGLAAASNLDKLSAGSKAEGPITAKPEQKVAKIDQKPSIKENEDSISFKVRPLKR